MFLVSNGMHFIFVDHAVRFRYIRKKVPNTQIVYMIL